MDNGIIVFSLRKEKKVKTLSNKAFGVGGMFVILFVITSIQKEISIFSVLKCEPHCRKHDTRGSHRGETPTLFQVCPRCNKDSLCQEEGGNCISNYSW